jgi:hypothetical protein
MREHTLSFLFGIHPSSQTGICGPHGCNIGKIWTLYLKERCVDLFEELNDQNRP